MKRSFANGFTLIETIVVIAVIGLTLPVLFSVIFTLMRQQVKIYRLSQIKREGDYVINLMENTIRNRAVTIYKSAVLDDVNIVCKTAGSSWPNPYFFDEDKRWFVYSASGNSVVSTSANLSPPPINLIINLTSSKIIVSGFSISCSRNSVYSPASISLSFDVCYDTGLPNCATTRPEEFTPTLHYQTRIKLRNY